MISIDSLSIERYAVIKHVHTWLRHEGGPRNLKVAGLKGLHSLLDVGYARAGLDDDWQLCNASGGE